MLTPVVENSYKLLRDGIEANLGQIQTALERYLDAPGEAEVLAGVVELVDQIRGGFVMLGQTEAATLCQSLATMAARFAAPGFEPPERAREAVLRAVLVLPRYLEWMEREGDRPGFRLAPVIADLRAELGNDPATGAVGADTGAVARESRPRLQRALLALLRGSDRDHALSEAMKVFGGMRSAAGDATRQRLWTDAGALARALSAGGLELNLDAHRLLRDLDQLLRLEGTQGPAGDDGALHALQQRLEAVLARSPAGETSAHMPGTVEAPALLDADTSLQIAGQLNESLALVRDAIDRFARDPGRHAELLEGQQARIHDLGNVLALLDLQVPARIAWRVRDAVGDWAAGRVEATADAVMQQAADLCLVESGIEALADGDLPAGIAAMAPDEADESECRRLLADFDVARSRRALATEALRTLQYVRDAVGVAPDDLAVDPVPGEIAAVAAALAMLDCRPGFELVRGLADVVRAMRASGGISAEGSRAAVAEGLVAIEYVLRALGDGRAPDPTLLERADAGLRELASELQIDLSPADAALLETKDEVPAPTRAATSAIAFPPAPVEAEGPPPERAPSEPADAEFVQVFFEEAAGEVSTLLDALGRWRESLSRDDSLMSMRRSFHTLKGSGRMVGEMQIGEFAWRFERLLNTIMDGQAPASEEVATLLGDAAACLQTVVEEGRVDPASAGAMQALAARADAMAEAPVPTLVPGAELPEPETSELPTLLPEPAQPAGPDEAMPGPAAAPLEVDLTEPTVPAPETLEPEESERPALEREAPQPLLLHDVVAPHGTDGSHAETGAGPDAAPIGPDTVVPAVTEARPAVDTDPELVEVFLAEAAEVLDHSDNVLQRWREDPADPEVLNDLRRAMHTLKGSSRMAGFSMIGNLAHASESLLDAVAAGDVVADDRIFTAIQHVLDDLSAMAAQARRGERLAPDETLLQGVFDLLGHGAEEAAVPAASGQPLPDTAADSARGLDGMDRDLVQVFLVEAADILQASEQAVQGWMANLSSRERLTDLRRSMHTLKGSSRMAGFAAIGEVAHALEGVLDSVAGGERRADPDLLARFQGALGRVSGMLAEVRDAGRIPAVPDGLLEQLAALAGTGAGTSAPTAAPVPRAPVAPPVAQDSIRVNARLLNTLFDQMGESSIFRARIDQGAGALRFGLNELEQTVGRLQSQLRRLEIETETQILFRYEEGRGELHAEFDPLELDRFSELQQLSRSLMEIVDDLNNIRHSLEDQTQEISFLLDQQAKVNKVIQENLMRTRMVKFSTVVPRLRRVVRQAAQELGKQAELVIEGESDLDRTVLEHIVAPLEHLLRNSLSHGIESPAERLDAGKSETGTISIRLHREGAELVLVVEDDGAGLDFEAIRTKGVSMGLLRPTQRPSEAELVALLLRPGFSTAREVTQISGRGVGMDVVHEAIRAMRGTLNIRSRRLRGASFVIRLPFSLAVTQALLVRAGGEIYAIPMLSVEAISRLNEGEFDAYLRGEPVSHEYSGRRYDLHSLAALFGSGPQAVTGEDHTQRPAAVLCHSGEASASLQVDAVLGNQEIIVKPLGPQLHRVPGISGATVLGDGSVVVVLELAALVRNLASESQRHTEERTLRELGRVAGEAQVAAMVIDDSITMRKVTGRILERNGIRVAAAKDGVEAVAMLEANPPDLVVLDIEMPRMDGFEVLAHIRNQPHLRHLKVVMVTSRSGEKHRDRARTLGVDDYLIKPYQEEELMRSVRNLLGERLGESVS